MNKESLSQIQEIENIAIISFNKLARNNPDIPTLVSRFKDDLQKLKLRKEIRVILFTGFDKIFSDSDLPGAPNPTIDISQFRMSESISSIKIPSLSFLNGKTFDHGLELALATDIRICSETAQFRMGQLLSGGIPWDGGTQRFPKIVGKGRAIEIALTCREINAEEALSIGLVSRIISDLNFQDESIKIANQITFSSPIAVKFLKESIFSGLELHINEGLKLEADLNFLLQNSFDRAEGLKSFLSSKKPKFRGE